MTYELDNKRITTARRWSLFAEMVNKLIVPITNMLLARLISPTAFGIVTTATMIFSFGDIFSTGGFPNFIIQKQFENNDYEQKAINIAFTSNLCISFFIWIFIIIFQNQLANVVGINGYNLAIVIACFQLIITAFSSIQIAILKKQLEFQKLFKIRLITSIIPLIISVPLAFLGFSYWAIIISNLLKELVTVIYLQFNSKLKLNLYFNFYMFKEMFNFCIWSLLESIIIWLCTWVDSIIVGRLFSPYEVGVWKTSATMITGLFGIIKSITIPVLFSSLCALQNDIGQYNYQVHLTRKVIALIMFPISFGIIFFNELAVYITLGTQWQGAEAIFISKSIFAPLVYSIPYIASEIYRSKGQPKVSALIQFIHVCIFIPLAVFFAKFGFDFYIKMFPIFDLIFTMLNIICLKFLYSYSVVNIIKDLIYPFIYSIIMLVVIYLLKSIIGFSIFKQFILIAIGAILYLFLTFSNKSTKNILFDFFIEKK